MANRSEIVIGGDGVVLAVTGDVPADLVDARLADCHMLPRETREAGAELLRALRTAGDCVVSRTVALDGAGRSAQLLAIGAVPLRRAATDVSALLKSKLGVLFSQASAAGVKISVSAATDVPKTVSVDAEKLAWSVTTLVGNSLRYAQTGSRRLHGETIEVTCSYDSATSEITVDVRDDGPGIPADTVARLFARDGLNVRGSGLALLLISDVMAAHGGRVAVQSSTDPVGHGTTIRLTFPTR